MLETAAQEVQESRPVLSGALHYTHAVPRSPRILHPVRNKQNILLKNMSEPPAKRPRTTENTAGGALSAQEATQYDRQIRLWGLDSQRRYVGLCRFHHQNYGGCALERVQPQLTFGKRFVWSCVRVSPVMPCR